MAAERQLIGSVATDLGSAGVVIAPVELHHHAVAWPPGVDEDPVDPYVDERQRDVPPLASREEVVLKRSIGMRKSRLVDRERLEQQPASRPPWPQIDGSARRSSWGQKSSLARALRTTFESAEAARSSIVWGIEVTGSLLYICRSRRRP
jgi:hypothetical protein